MIKTGRQNKMKYEIDNWLKENESRLQETWDDSREANL